jgi:predicted peroxiredoxin
VAGRAQAVVNLTVGADDGERATLAFQVANAALRSGRETILFCTMEAVRLGLPGHADKIAIDGMTPLREHFAEFAALGGELWLCPTCFGRRSLDESAVVPNARVAGSTPLWNWVGEGATVLTY